MKTFNRILSIAAIAALACLPSFAQVTLTSTTLGAAVTLTDQSIVVASATGVVVNDVAFVGREAMRVTAISGTRLTVIRGLEGTRNAAHASGTTIYIDPPNYFSRTDRWGTCTATNEPVLPVVNTSNGIVWQCGNGGNWYPLQGVEQIVEVSFHCQAAATCVDQSFFVANGVYVLVAAREVHAVAETTAAGVLIQITKDTSTNAPGAGTDLLTTGFNGDGDAGGTANTVQTGSLITTAATLKLAAGDRLSIDFEDTHTELVGVTITVTLARL